MLRLKRRGPRIVFLFRGIDRRLRLRDARRSAFPLLGLRCLIPALRRLALLLIPVKSLCRPACRSVVGFDRLSGTGRVLS